MQTITKKSFVDVIKRSKNIQYMGNVYGVSLDTVAEVIRDNKDKQGRKRKLVKANNYSLKFKESNLRLLPGIKYHKLGSYYIVHELAEGRTKDNITVYKIK